MNFWIAVMWIGSVCGAYRLGRSDERWATMEADCVRRLDVMLAALKAQRRREKP